MSRDAAIAFHDFLQGEPDLANQVRAQAGRPTAILEIAHRHGFECSETDLEQAFGELAAAELEQVAGGRRIAYDPAFTGGVRVATADVG